MNNKNVLARVVNACSKIMSEKQASLNELYESRAVRKGRKIAGDSAHVLTRDTLNFYLLGDATEC